MTDIYKCTPEELMKNAKLPFRVMESEEAMYDEIARIMADTIKKNGGKRTVIICPVGPVGQYPKFAEIVNRERISLKNAVFINMDEYLGDDGKAIDYDNVLSFHKTMDEMLYSRIDKELLMPEENRMFPEPGREAQIDEFIDNTDIDLCLTSFWASVSTGTSHSMSRRKRTIQSRIRNIKTSARDALTFQEKRSQTTAQTR